MKSISGMRDKQILTWIVIRAIVYVHPIVDIIMYTVYRLSLMFNTMDVCTFAICSLQKKCHLDANVWASYNPLPPILCLGGLSEYSSLMNNTYKLVHSLPTHMITIANII